MTERYQFTLLHDAGSIPGIPGSHGRGSYVIDWQERSIHPAMSLEDFLLRLESAQPQDEMTAPDAPVASSDGQETGQEERAAILPPEPETTGEQAGSEGQESAPENVASPVAGGGSEQTEASASEGAQA